jgi:CrcB protein
LLDSGCYGERMVNLMLIAIFGAIGALGRYSVSGWTYRVLGESFPFGTLAVNLIGCFALGAIMHTGQNTELIAAHYRQGITVGMLGAFTTFSTFGYETLRQLENGQWLGGLANVAVNVLVGLLCVWLGIETARYFVGGA